MERRIPKFDDFIFESVDGTFVVKAGEAYQSLWNNSSPSISYNDTSEIFTNQRAALKYVQSKLKVNKTKTSMGQGGIPGGYSYTVVDLFEIKPDMKPEEWTARYQAENAGAKIIKLTGGGRLEEDAIKQTEEIIALSSPENVEKLEPDTKDIKRADDIFSKGWRNDEKVFRQLVAISDPKKLVRRMKAMLYAQINAALKSKAYYKDYELDKGLDKWFDGLPWMFTYIYELHRNYNKKWGTKLTREDWDNLKKAVLQSVENKIKQENPELV